MPIVKHKVKIPYSFSKYTSSNSNENKTSAGFKEMPTINGIP